MKKRSLFLILAIVMVLALVPSAALAADDAPWADDAVKTLNDIYGSGVFSASMETMTVGDAYTVLSGMGCSVEGITANSSDNLTRGNACEVLATIFKLPVGEKSAIVYLHEQNIVNGTGVDENGNAILDESGTITKAQFAVLAYRILNTVGGGLGSSVEGLTPGTEEYFAWMYLSARCCVPFDTDAETLGTKISGATVKTIVPEGSNPEESGEEAKLVWNNNYTADKSGEELWNAWAVRLNSLKSEDETIDTTATTIGEAQYSADDTLLQAAVKIVNAYIEAGGSKYIFADVTLDGQNTWCYDGVMYLFDRNVVQGFGNGNFGPNQEIIRAQFAALLFRLDGNTLTDAEKAIEITGNVPDWAKDAVKAVVSRGYMTPPEDANDDWWNSTITREEAVVGCIRMCANVFHIELNESTINTSILDRFSDASDISDYANPCMAYAVSHGIISGTSEGKIMPTQGSSRGEMGVLLYRALVGLDTSKMKDYEDNVSYALPSAAEEGEGA